MVGNEAIGGPSISRASEAVRVRREADLAKHNNSPRVVRSRIQEACEATLAAIEKTRLQEKSHITAALCGQIVDMRLVYFPGISPEEKQMLEQLKHTALTTADAQDLVYTMIEGAQRDYEAATQGA